MSRCILCGETDPELIVPHHTIPRSLAPLWKEKIPLCYRCHKKVHRYIIKDFRKLVLDFRNVFMQMQLVFSSCGLFVGEGEADVSKVLGSVVYHMNNDEKEISINTISKEIGLKNTTIGYLLRNLGIVRTRRRTGMVVRFTERNIEKIIPLSIKNGLFLKRRKPDTVGE